MPRIEHRLFRTLSLHVEWDSQNHAQIAKTPQTSSYPSPLLTAKDRPPAIPQPPTSLLLPRADSPPLRSPATYCRSHSSGVWPAITFPSLVAPVLLGQHPTRLLVTPKAILAIGRCAWALRMGSWEVLE